MGIKDLARAVLAAGLLLSFPACKPPVKNVFRIELPIDCVPQKTCWIAKFVDIDPGPGIRDYMCASRAENGHSGVDFALRDLEAMRRGVRVLAAAPGVVVAVRGGMKDESVLEKGPDAVKGRECGNGLVIDHGGGWVTQYCHMRVGLLVRKGDRVEAGAPLGFVGLSGSTEYPHLHFTVRLHDRVVDPFLGLEDSPARNGTCGEGKHPLWGKTALALLAYTPDAEAIVLWAEIFGLEKGDELTMRILDPQGTLFAEHVTVMEKTKARWFQFVGKKRKENPWPTGSYRGTVEVVRKTPAGLKTAAATKNLAVAAVGGPVLR